jgi:hypothetical protein
MNVEIGTEAAQFPEKEYISGIFLAVWAIYIFPRLVCLFCHRKIGGPMVEFIE